MFDLRSRREMKVGSARPSLSPSSDARWRNLTLAELLQDATGSTDDGDQRVSATFPSIGNEAGGETGEVLLPFRFSQTGELLVLTD